MTGVPASASELARLTALARPCFCGEAPVLADWQPGSTRVPHVQCRACGDVMLNGKTLEEAVGKWNVLVAIMPAGAGRLTPEFVAQAMALFAMIGSQLAEAGDRAGAGTMYWQRDHARTYERACWAWLQRHAGVDP